MTVPPLILGFDTSGPHCAAALLSGETVIAEQCETMVRGQAERLMPMMHDLLAGAGVGWSDLTALGVGTGPGNFTGLRIAVSAARGLALGLEIPAVGVTGCQARALLNPGQPCTIPAPRDQVYLCDLDDPRVTPSQMSRAEAETRAATAISAEASPPGLAAAIARVAAAHWQTTTEPPAPVYARAADAAPSRHTPPALLD